MLFRRAGADQTGRETFNTGYDQACEVSRCVVSACPGGINATLTVKQEIQVALDFQPSALRNGHAIDVAIRNLPDSLPLRSASYPEDIA
jgi:hypothetical protein